MKTVFASVSIHLNDGSKYVTATDMEMSIYTSLLEGHLPDNKMYKFGPGTWRTQSGEGTLCESVYLRSDDIVRILVEPFEYN